MRKGSKENPLTVADQEALKNGQSLEEKTIIIKSAALTDLGCFCNYSYEHTVAQNTTNTVNIKSGVLVHDDLKKAFKKLHPHLAVICEEIASVDIGDIDNIDDFDTALHALGSLEDRVAHFTVSKFQISGSGENEGVILTGQKRLSTGEYVSLTSPKIKWIDGYAFIHDLRIHIEAAVEEVELYMQGKCAPKLVQTEMVFGEEEGENMLNV